MWYPPTQGSGSGLHLALPCIGTISTAPVTSPLPPSAISASRVQDMAAALLLHNFILGDLIRWLGGDYTHDHINMPPIESAVSAIRDHVLPQDSLS